MKNVYFALFMLLLPVVSHCQSKLEGKPMPLLPNKTLDGKTIDAHYFEGHVTVVSFMFIGCRGCMNEIGVLNQLHGEYVNNEKVQLLCVAAQFREQMVQFNQDTSSMLGKIRKAFHVDPIRYDIQPACINPNTMAASRPDVKYMDLKSQCSIIEGVYGFTAFPTTFFVDKKGVIRKIDEGGPAKQNDQWFHDKMKEEIERLLAE